jgi:hypothetical protein
MEVLVLVLLHNRLGLRMSSLTVLVLVLVLGAEKISSRRLQISCSRCSSLEGLMIIGKTPTEPKNSSRVWKLYRLGL